MNGHYRMISNEIVACVVKKPAVNDYKKKKRPPVRRRGRIEEVVFDLPDQEFHFVSSQILAVNLELLKL